MAAVLINPGMTIPVRPARERHRRHAAAVYRRRRVVALVLLAIALSSAALAGRAALQILGGGPLAAAEVHRTSSSAATPRVVELDAAPVAKATYVVRPGDTLWTIARRIQPAGDVRPLVDALASTRHGRPLQPGERITMP